MNQERTYCVKLATGANGRQEAIYYLSANSPAQAGQIALGFHRDIFGGNVSIRSASSTDKPPYARIG